CKARPLHAPERLIIGGSHAREFIGSLIGTAVAWPLAASAQQPAKVYRIAIVHPSYPVKEMNESGRIWFKALFGELRRLGYIEGQNIIIERYSGEGNAAHYAEVANEVVRQQPDVIFVVTGRMVRNFKAATTTTIRRELHQEKRHRKVELILLAEYLVPLFT